MLSPDRSDVNGAAAAPTLSDQIVARATQPGFDPLSIRCTSWVLKYSSGKSIIVVPCGPWGPHFWFEGDTRSMSDAVKIRVERRDPAKNKGTGSRVAPGSAAAG